MGTTYNNTATDSATFTASSPTYGFLAAGIINDTASIASVVTGGLGLVLEADDTVNVTDTTLGAIIAELELTDGAEIGDEPTGVKLVLVEFDESVTITDTLTGGAVLRETLAEDLNFIAILTINGQEFIAWAANADTLAHTRYENFDFNSMCRLGNRYLAANENGLFALDASTDAGENINFFATLPTHRVADARSVRIPKVYMGFKSDGPMYIQTVTEDGKKRIYLFNKKSAQMAGSGATLGRGVKSSYWTFDILNGEGAEAVLDQIEFFPIVLSRRINS